MSLFNVRISSTRALAAFVIVLITAVTGFAQESGDTANGPAFSPSDSSPSEPPGGNRVFGFLPNYRTVDESNVTSHLTSAQKLNIAVKDSSDYPLFAFSAALAGIGQWSRQNPAFGQGMSGFSKRFATNFSDQAIGNILSEGILPVALHEDPRYYRRGTGSVLSRTGYALSLLLITHTDSGKSTFNVSEWAGNAAATAISNAYYPDGRTVGANAGKFMEQCTLDGLGHVLREFWPDIKQKFSQHSAPKRP